ncbi:MAG: hypothetical protein ACXVDA_11200, partial [Ktedonobacterales bacterium]
DLASRAYNGGHNYWSWRNDVWHGLEWLISASEAPLAPVGHMNRSLSTNPVDLKEEGSVYAARY